MSLEQKTRHLLCKYAVTPRRRLGQCFMVSGPFLELMTSYATLTRIDVVLEVGAGFGFLTQCLAQQAGRVVAVEADHRLVKALLGQLAGFDNVEVVEGNVLQVPVPFFNKVVSNPPFSISSPLLFWLLRRHFERAVLTFQEEFARRLDAQVGSKDYSRLTVSTYYYADVERLDTLPKEAFYPKPDVNAAIVRLTPKKAPPFKLKDTQVFNEVVRTLFSQRNRKVRKAAAALFSQHPTNGTAIIYDTDDIPFKDKRVRDLAPEDFGVLANELSQ
jgi:16S rRNA (adenine1518-N6/adenine1519-N6)-dimethyltransferase